MQGVFNEFQWVKTSWDDFLMGFAGFYVVFYVVVFFFFGLFFGGFGRPPVTYLTNVMFAGVGTGADAVPTHFICFICSLFFGFF